MDREVMRLECLKLSVSRTVSLEETIARAEQFFVFVTEPERAQNVKSPTTSTQGAGVTAGKDGGRPGKG